MYKFAFNLAGRVRCHLICVFTHRHHGWAHVGDHQYTNTILGIQLATSLVHSRCRSVSRGGWGPSLGTVHCWQLGFGKRSALCDCHGVTVAGFYWIWSLSEIWHPFASPLDWAKFWKSMFDCWFSTSYAAKALTANMWFPFIFHSENNIRFVVFLYCLLRMLVCPLADTNRESFAQGAGMNL